MSSKWGNVFSASSRQRILLKNKNATTDSLSSAKNNHTTDPISDLIATPATINGTEQDNSGPLRLSRRRYGHKMAKRIFPKNLTAALAKKPATPTVTSDKYQRRRYGQRIF